MLKSHKLSEEELIEFYNIGKLLGSSDIESVQLGIGLLRNYPGNIKSKNRGGFGLTENLQYLLDEYTRRINKPYFTLYGILPIVNPIISFICNLLLDGYYYEEE